MTNRTLPPLAMRAAFQPSTLNEEARTVELVWTTGARVLRGWWDQFWEELSLDPKHVRMERLNNGAPFLADHAGHRVASTLGVVETARLEKGRGVAVVRFARAEDDPEADKVFRKIRDGIIQNVSVGYRVHKMEKVEDGEGQIPVMRAVDWEPYEISAVAMGADDGAGFRSADDTPNPVEVISRGGAPQKESKMSEPEKQDPGPVTEAARQAELEAARKAAVEAERTRAAEIRKSVRSAGLEPELAEQLISDDTPVDKARALVLEKLAERNAALGPNQYPSGAVEVGTTERDKRLRGMTAWVLERTGVVPRIEQAIGNKYVGRLLKDTATDGGEFRGLSMVDLARECLERSGVSTRGMDRMTLVGRAFTHRSGGYQSTSDFAVIFESAIYKTMLSAYATVDDTWRLFCGTTTVSDFRTSNRYRLGSFGTLDSLNESGEYKNKAFPDGEKSTVSTGTKGNIIGLTRQTIINDDMGALANLATALGRAAGLTIESDVYTLLAQNSGLGPTQSDSQPFFHSNRANVNSTGSALSVAGLDADRVVMGSQRDISSNEYLNLRPAVLLVPLGLGGEARVVNDAAFEPTDNKFQKPNKVRGLFRTIVDTARLSGTRRYLFTDPMMVPAIVVAFLEGQGEAPVMDSEDGWRVDGTEWRVRLDAKAQMFDPKAAVTNAGA